MHSIICCRDDHREDWITPTELLIIIIKAMLKKLLVWHCRPGGSQGGSVDRIFFFLLKKLEVSASNPFEMQAKLYAELTDDIFRYYSVPKNSLLKRKTSLSEPLSEAIKPTVVSAFPMSSILPLA